MMIKKRNLSLKRQFFEKNGHPAPAHTSKQRTVEEIHVLSNFTHTSSVYDISHVLKLPARSLLTMQGLSAVSGVNLAVNSIKSRTQNYIKVGLLAPH